MSFLYPVVPKVETQLHFPQMQNATTLSIVAGSSVKDLVDGSDTPMKVLQNKTQLEAKRVFEVEMRDYDAAIQLANERAIVATHTITAAKSESLKYNLAFAASIIFAVGMVVIAAATGSWIVGMLAVPVACGAGYVGYHAHQHYRKVDELEKTINAPNHMAIPVEREVAPYDPANDLDLKSTRLALVHNYATKTLRQIHCSDRSHKEIVDYALLDGKEIVRQTMEQRGTFYAQWIQLQRQYDDVVRCRDSVHERIQRVFDQYARELVSWSSNRERELSCKELAIDEVAKRSDIFSPTVIAFARGELESEKADRLVLIERFQTDIERWRIESLKVLEVAYRSTVEAVESLYGNFSISYEKY